LTTFNLGKELRSFPKKREQSFAQFSTIPIHY